MPKSAPPPIKATYSFPQEPAIVTSSVSQHIDALLNVGVDPDHILDIYLDARRYAQINNARAANSPILNPYRYLRKTDGMTTEQLRVSANALESTYNAAVLTWQHVASLNYLSEYHAHMHKGYNDSGFENGMLSQRLFTSIGETNRLLLVDPSPSFLLHLANHPDLVNRPITMVFSDSRYADICNQHPWPQSIAVADTDHLDDSCNYIRTACIIATTTEYGGTIQLLNQVRSAGISTILLVSPMSHFTAKYKEGKLRRLIANDLDLRQIVLVSYELPGNHAVGNSNDVCKFERCILAMYNRAPSSDDINIESVSLQDNKLVATQSILISYADFAECRRTLGALYRQAIRVPAGKPSRKDPEPLYFAPEICFWHRIETVRKEGKPTAYRAVYRFYNYPSIKQQSRNKYARGKFIIELIGPPAASPAAAVNNLDNLILPNTDDECHMPSETAAIIRNTVNTHYGATTDLSLKTFWFLHLPELLKSENYNHKICCELFLGPSWQQNPLCYIIVNDNDDVEQSTDEGDQLIGKTEYVQRSLAAYAAITNASPTHQALILEQLHLIWQYDLRTHPARINPIAPLIDDVTDRDNTKEDQREALALRAWTLEQMQALDRLITQKISHKPMAVALQMRLTVGIRSGEISALVIDSFDYAQRTLTVTHNMPQTGSVSNEYGTTSDRQKLPHIWKKRTYSIPDQLAVEIQEVVIENKIILCSKCGIAEKDTGAFPLFPSPNDPTQPILTRRISEKCAELVDQLNIPPWIISCSDDGISTDINKFGGDSWAENWCFHARNTMHLDAGSVSYLSGVKPDKVADTNYRDFTLRFQQRKFQLAHERFIALIKYAEHTLRRTWETITLNRRRRSIPYNPYPAANELVITYDASIGDDVELTVDVPHGCHIDIRYE